MLLEDVTRSGFQNIDKINKKVLEFIHLSNRMLCSIGLYYFDYTPSNIFYNKKLDEFKIIDIVESLEVTQSFRETSVKRFIQENKIDL